MYYAHSTPRQDRSDWQALCVHLNNVGIAAAKRADKFGASKAALLAGLGHDLGKYSIPFQKRLAGGPPVDHATAGARAIVGAAAEGNPRRSNLSRRYSETVAYLVAGHHSGLADRRGGPGSLEHRLHSAVIPELDPTWAREIDLGAPGHPRLKPHPDGRDAFQLAFLGRMIFSTLIDADRCDTQGHSVDTGQEKYPDRDWPRLADRVDTMIAALDAHVACLARPGSDRALNVIRDRIFRVARERAGCARGLYTLTVPTGGGKTLSVMRFALGQAACHRPTTTEPRGIERIVVALPFTTVTEQTAEILKTILGEDSVLEHHSAIEAASGREEERFREAGEDVDRKRQVAMEDWAAPVVVTTNVQLFESLYSHRPSRCRKLHNLANSVIVLDEAQTIPRRLLRPCLAALDELARNYGCTIVLCTATQPAVGCPGAHDDRGLRGGLELGPEREIAPNPAGLHDAMRRATISVPTAPTATGKLGAAAIAAPMSDDDLVAALAAVEQGFVIVNSRRHALSLYRTTKRAQLAGLVHLTTRQYAAHRREIVAGIKSALDPDKPRPCRLVATSLIEAGIDLDFAAGWRALAGLESIVQSAGRVNREGRRPREASVLTVFTPADAADAPPPDIAGLIGDLGRMANSHPDLAHPDAVRAYFEEVYWRTDHELDLIEVAEDGRRRVLDCFRADSHEPTTDFAYRTVGENFRMVEERMRPVIVARDDVAREALARLNWRKVSAGAVARDLQSFVVQVPERDRARLIARADVQYRREDLFGEQFPVLEAGKLYDPNVGLLWEADAELGSHETIF